MVFRFVISYAALYESLENAGYMFLQERRESAFTLQSSQLLSVPDLYRRPGNSDIEVD